MAVVTLVTLASVWGYRDPQGPRRWWDSLRGAAAVQDGTASASAPAPAAGGARRWPSASKGRTEARLS